MDTTGAAADAELRSKKFGFGPSIRLARDAHSVLNGASTIDAKMEKPLPMLPCRGAAAHSRSRNPLTAISACPPTIGDAKLRTGFSGRLSAMLPSRYRSTIPVMARNSSYEPRKIAGDNLKAQIEVAAVKSQICIKGRDSRLNPACEKNSIDTTIGSCSTQRPSIPRHLDAGLDSKNHNLAVTCGSSAISITGRCNPPFHLAGGTECPAIPWPLDSLAKSFATLPIQDSSVESTLGLIPENFAATATASDDGALLEQPPVARKSVTHLPCPASGVTNVGYMDVTRIDETTNASYSSNNSPHQVSARLRSLPKVGLHTRNVPCSRIRKPAVRSSNYTQLSCRIGSSLAGLPRTHPSHTISTSHSPTRMSSRGIYTGPTSSIAHSTRPVADSGVIDPTITPLPPSHGIDSNTKPASPTIPKISPIPDVMGTTFDELSDALDHLISASADAVSQISSMLPHLGDDDDVAVRRIADILDTVGQTVLTARAGHILALQLHRHCDLLASHTLNLVTMTAAAARSAERQARRVAKSTPTPTPTPAPAPDAAAAAAALQNFSPNTPTISMAAVPTSVFSSVT